MEQSDPEQIRTLLTELNEAWLEGRWGVLTDCFRNDVVTRGPQLQEMARGREASVKSYQDFIRLATVREFKAREPVIDVFGTVAVASCPWEIDYRMNDRDIRESGHDLLVLTYAEGEWKVVWRAVLSS